MKNMLHVLLSLTLAMPTLAGIEWYAVDPMGERPYLPDRAPDGGRRGAPLAIIAAKGEYEPCSFVVCADRDLGKARFEVGDLKSEDGDTFPASKIDLKTVKVWYQCGNAWTSYFADPKLKLCPELLLNDEDLVKVDLEKGWNYARLTEKDGSVSYRWLNAPRAFKDGFLCMKPNFADAKTHQGATLKKGEYKQFWLTAEVGKDVKAGLYKGEIKIKTKGGGEQWKIPLVLRVLDFELPLPKCYDDIEKDYVTWFCEYVGVDIVRKLNGGDKALAEKQVVSILADFVRHGEIYPSYQEHEQHPEYGRQVGMCFTNHLLAGRMILSDKAATRYDARRQKERLTERFGGGDKYLEWGDEFSLAYLRGIRGMAEIYQELGFLFPMNCKYAYEAGGYFCDLWWPPFSPDHERADEVLKYNQVNRDGYFGWYSKQHVGAENPAFNRRQYGFGPYRAGFSCNYNYAHFLDGWNDIGRELYRPMMFVYGHGNGCIDTLQWEGFREGQDDIRYATLLQQVARPLARSNNLKCRYAAKKALQLLADADGDDMDLTTLRLEMIRHIQHLKSLNAK